MSDFQAIADRVEIEALRGEFTDTGMMRDYGCRAQPTWHWEYRPPASCPWRR